LGFVITEHPSCQAGDRCRGHGA